MGIGSALFWILGICVFYLIVCLGIGWVERKDKRHGQKSVPKVRNAAVLGSRRSALVLHQVRRAAGSQSQRNS